MEALVAVSAACLAIYDMAKSVDRGMTIGEVQLLRKSGEFQPGHRIATRFAAPRMDCEVDPNRLRQIFWNLATNALKAIPSGGSLTIETGWLDGDRVEIRFTDDGIGMDESQQKLYFQPFSSSFREGTGLGAAIVYRLVEEHGGKIHLESSAGGGTCVRIELPRWQAQQGGGHEPSFPHAAGG